MKLCTSTLLASALLGYGSAAVVEREEGRHVNSSTYDFVRWLCKLVNLIPALAII
jgi:hypothetical protein